MKRYTVPEAANELGISTSLVYALLAARKLRHERIDLGRGRGLIPADALDEYRA
ncbi:MAG: excisionase family DNA-binding protein [Gemmataceae bacterium]